MWHKVVALLLRVQRARETPAADHLVGLIHYKCRKEVNETADDVETEV